MKAHADATVESVVLLQSVDCVCDSVPVGWGEWRGGKGGSDGFLVVEFGEGVEVVEGDFAFRRSDAGEEGPMALVVHRA